jgi:predicted RNase H-like nuclease (RuvC/YqgF family)
MSTRNTLILGLAGVAIFYLLYKQKEFDTSSYLNKIVDLEKKVDSLHSQNKTLNVELKTLEDALARYDKEVDSLENSIVIIKRRTDEKLRNVSSLTLSELQSFFTERYNSSSTPTGTNSPTSGEGSDNR